MAKRSFLVEDKLFEVAGVNDQDPYLIGISGLFEKKFQDFCRTFLRDDFVAMDIGANIGATSIIMSHYLRNGRIIALEPGKSIFSLLINNLKNNHINNVDAYNYAVSDKTTTLRFVENSAYGHISLENSTEPPRGDNSVSAYSLDDLVEKFNIDRLDFIKVDIEGFEPQFFAGAEKTLARFNPIIYFELNSWCLIDHANNNPLEFMRKIVEQFRFIWRVDKSYENGRILEKIISHDIGRALVHDNIALHGSVDDIVVSNNENLFDPRIVEMMDICGDLSRKNTLLEEQISTLTQSRSWRYTAALRAFRRRKPG